MIADIRYVMRPVRPVRLGGVWTEKVLQVLKAHETIKTTTNGIEVISYSDFRWIDVRTESEDANL